MLLEATLRAKYWLMLALTVVRQSFVALPDALELVLGMLSFEA